MGIGGLWDVAVRAVSSAYHAVPAWPESVVVLFNYRLNSTEEMGPLPARMPRRVGVAEWKDVWKVRQARFEVMVFNRQDRKFRLAS
jgi:hypothetical protein